MAEKKPKRARSERFSSPLVEFGNSYIYKPDAKDAPNAGEYADDKFKVTAFVEKERVEELKPIKQIILATARKEWGKEIKYSELETPFQDGDEKLPEKIERINDDSSKDEKAKKTAIERAKAQLTGKFYFTAKSNRKPGVVGPDTKPLPEGEDVQNTDIGRLRLTAGAYVRTATEIVNGKKKTVNIKGVNLSLEGIQKAKTGPRPFAASDGATEFEPLETDDDVTGGEVSEDEDFGDEPKKEAPKKEAKKTTKAAKEPEPEVEDEAADDDEII